MHFLRSSVWARPARPASRRAPYPTASPPGQTRRLRPARGRSHVLHPVRH